ncbi:hypothetical protein FRC06_001899 [Ceratobasidium sp. 370]|nr:hypothetical protein FRC06_001899 [Ceratobasidium sp. 370]
MVFTRELSAVSLPTRERAAAKAKHRMLKQGQSAAPTTTRAKTSRAVAPTLASTRQPRRGRTELTYTNKGGELVVNSVNRRNNEEPRHQDIPFLPGQEDLQRKDDEGSMTEPEDISPSMQELLGYGAMGPDGVGLDMEDEDEDDMDVEGDDDADGEDDVGFDDANLDNPAATLDFDTASGFSTALGFGAASNFGTTLGFAGTSGMTFGEANEGPFGYSQARGGMDFTSGVDPDELQTLFGGLNRFGLDDSALDDSFSLPTTTPPINFQNFGAVLPDTTPPMRDQSPSIAQPDGEPNLLPRSDTPALFGSTGAPGNSLDSSLYNHTPGLRQNPSSPYRATQPLPPTSLSLPARCAISRAGTPCPPNRPRPLAATRGESLILSRTGTPRFSRHNPLQTPTRGGTQALVSAIRHNSRLSTPRSGAPSPTTSVRNPTSPHPASQAPDTLPLPVATPPHRSNSLPDLTSTDTQEPAEQDLDPSAHGEYSLSANNSSYATGQPVPTVQDIKRKILEYYQLTTRTRRDRHIPSDTPLLANGLPRMCSLTEEEKKFLMLIEYFLLYQMVSAQAWLADPAGTLDKAMEYGQELVGKSREDIIVTAGFEELALSKLSNLRSDALRNVYHTVSRILDVVSGDKQKTNMLMSNDLFVYRDHKNARAEMFRASIIHEVLLDIFFRSGKKLGLVFILELCTPDGAECASLALYGKLWDRTATRGLPVAAIAFAATMVYFVLDKMNRDVKKLRFDDQGYKQHWQRYMRNLVALPHLGALRNELLDRIKQEHLRHWPADELDDEATGLQLAW